MYAALQAPDAIGHRRELKMENVKNDEALAAALKSMPTLQASALQQGLTRSCDFAMVPTKVSGDHSRLYSQSSTVSSPLSALFHCLDLRCWTFHLNGTQLAALSTSTSKCCCAAALVSRSCTWISVLGQRSAAAPAGAAASDGALHVAGLYASHAEMRCCDPWLNNSALAR